MQRFREKSQHLLQRINWSELFSPTRNNSSLNIRDVGIGIFRGVKQKETLWPVHQDNMAEMCTEVLRDSCAVLEIDSSAIVLGSKEMNLQAEIIPLKNGKGALFSLNEYSVYELTKDLASEIEILGRTLEKGDRAVQEIRLARIAKFIHRLVHETYHIRQILQDPEYAERTAEANKKDMEEYHADPGELAARGFGLRYLKEKQRQLQNKKSLTKVEQVMLKAITQAYTEIQEEVKIQAEFGRENK